MDYGSISANELASFCSDASSVEAWSEFVRRFQRPIGLVVLRTSRKWGGCSTNVLDDLVQEVFLRLCTDDCKLLKDFVSREEDSILGYLKVIATNVTHDHFRAEKCQKRGGFLQWTETDSGDLDFLVAKPGEPNPAEKAIQMDEIDRALRAFIPHVLTERDRTIFWLYFEQGFSAVDLGAIASIGLSVKGVESSIHRSTKQLREAMQWPPGPPSFKKGFPKASRSLKENG